MSLNEASHDLLKNTSTAAEDRQRSDYCYLFPELAMVAEAGCFTGTDEATSIQRLKDFEDCFSLNEGETPPPAMTISLPAAYTYFGQFLNHDISAPIGGLKVNVDLIPPAGIIGTLDLPGLEKASRADVATILQHFVNDQAEPLTLGSLYRDGPKRNAAAVANLFEADGKRFRLGLTSRAEPQVFTDMKKDPDAVHHAEAGAGIPAPDILREQAGPLIADRRNDGNLILSQLHLAFMLVHNKAVAALELQKPPPADVFAKARQLVTLHYHWLILNDFLPSLLSKTVLSRPLAQWASRQAKPNLVPMEFTTAAFRFGHSMVGRDYDFNANFGNGGALAESATFSDLFNFTSAGNMNDPGSDDVHQLPDHWVIDWNRMTLPPKPAAPGTGQPSGPEQIDMIIAPRMLDAAGDAELEAKHGSILFRNLLRGFHRRIPFGQQLAKACNVNTLSKEQVREAIAAASPTGNGAVDIAAEAERLGLLDETPAWLYFLCEAKTLEMGERLGPTASQIIADTIVGLMRQNPGSVLCHERGTWHPRQSPLKDKAGNALDSIRAFLLFATSAD